MNLTQTASSPEQAFQACNNIIIASGENPLCALEEALRLPFYKVANITPDRVYSSSKRVVENTYNHPASEVQGRLLLSGKWQFAFRGDYVELDANGKIRKVVSA